MRYLIVPSRQVFMENDIEDYGLINETFLYYELPDGIRKIIFVINEKEPDKAIEPVTKKEFSLQKIKNNKIIGKCIENDIVFISSEEDISEEVARMFFQKILDKDMASNYENAIHEAFINNIKRKVKSLF